MPVVFFLCFVDGYFRFFRRGRRWTLWLEPKDSIALGSRHVVVTCRLRYVSICELDGIVRTHGTKTKRKGALNKHNIILYSYCVLVRLYINKINYTVETSLLLLNKKIINKYV